MEGSWEGSDGTASGKAGSAPENSADGKASHKEDAHAGLLRSCLQDHFALENDDLLTFLQARCDFRELFPGDVLIEQDAIDDDVYFVLSGRLRALRLDKHGATATLGEIGRGETVGELALFTQEPRSARVVAIRNSFVARLTRETVETAIARQPAIAMSMTKTIIDRFRREQDKTKPPAPPVVITVLPISEGIDTADFVRRLVDRQSEYSGRIAVLDFDAVRGQIGSLRKPDILRPRGELSSRISALEGDHDVVFLIGDPEEAAWSMTAVHHADEVLMLANANGDPGQSHFEREMLEDDHIIHGSVALVLLHPEDAVVPRNTAKWLSSRKVDRHFHIRPEREKDMARLARILSGNAVGIVLSGGGARGFAHVGVMTALTEMGVEFDFVGGTSIGAIMGAFAAMEIEGEDFIETARRVFVTSPFGNLTGDYNIAPLISLIKGERARSITKMMVRERTGGETLDLEDTWKSFFVVASNFTKHREEVLTHGDFVKSLVASFSIPGLLPPVFRNGEALFDGGSFNNFPVDIMRGRFGAGKVIGVDLLSDYERRFELEEAPPPLAILRDTLRAKKKRRYRLPSLPDTLLTASIITAMARQKTMRGDVDLLFRPSLRGVSMLDWKKYDQVVGDTRARALIQLQKMDGTEALTFGIA